MSSNLTIRDPETGTGLLFRWARFVQQKPADLLIGGPLPNPLRGSFALSLDQVQEVRRVVVYAGSGPLGLSCFRLVVRYSVVAPESIAAIQLLLLLCRSPAAIQLCAYPSGKPVMRLFVFLPLPLLSLDRSFSDRFHPRDTQARELKT
jgi:hypothetical protein